MNKRFLFWGCFVILIIALIIGAPQNQHPHTETNHTTTAQPTNLITTNKNPLGLIPREIQPMRDLFTEPHPPTPKQTNLSSTEQTTQQKHTEQIKRGISFFGRVHQDNHVQAMLAFQDHVVLLMPGHCADHYCLTHMTPTNITLKNTQTRQLLTFALGDTL